jgi:putative DNA primase/helicase
MIERNDLNDLRAALNYRAADLATYLVNDKPNRAMSNKRELRFGTHGSMSVIISGPKVGSWFDYENNESGGMFDLIMREQGCRFIDAVYFARDYLGDLPAPTKPRPASLHIVGGSDHDANAERNQGFARKIWRNAESVDHPIARRYFERRGLTIPKGLDDRVLRFHPRCPFGRDTKHPCVIALFTGISDNEKKAITRIALTPEGEKIDRKMLGPIVNAAIKLSPDDDIKTTLHVGEGVETCLAGMLDGYTPTWVLGSAGAIARLPVLRGIKKLFVFGEMNDGGANARAVQACADRWQEDSKARIFVVKPLEGNDMNDALLAANSGGAK